jgi:hypothetical protein
MIKARRDYEAEDFRRTYGDEGIHWMPETQTPVEGQPDRLASE